MRECRGETTIEVPSGRWTALLVHESGAEGRTRWFRIPPFDDERVQPVEFGDGAALHIQAWRADLCSTLANATLLVTLAGLEAPGAARSFEVRTDASGGALVERLEPGVVTVSFPDAGPDARWPQAARLVVAPYGQPGELSCVLVEPRRLRRITVRPLLECSLGSAKLYLRCVDRDAALYPQSSPLADGVADRILAPDGLYELGILPGGVARVEPASIRVVGDMEVAVRIEPDPSACEIELLGIPATAFPVRVVAQSDDDLLEGDPDLLFVGPFGWGSSKARIAAGRSGVRLAALAHQRTFLGSAPLEVGRTAAVDMHEATLLQVDWIDGPLRGDRDVVLEVCGADVVLQRQFTLTLVSADGTYRPGYTTRVVVPRGRVELTAISANGVELWSRGLEANAPRQVTRIED